MLRRLAIGFALSAILAWPNSSPSRELSLQAQCFDERGDLAVLVINTGPQAGSILVGLVELADDTEFQRR